ncbi:MAG: endonuclease/exonuclease/phosphatase family protein, partial [Elusimicrobia bacterium]|nr:endonuclease/exonuclease/phosphatase family protein [Elusimicrobiota bacterium]
MKLLSWNVNGFRAVHRKGFPDFLKKAAPDVLCLQETKCELADLTPEMARYPGYEAEWHWSRKKGYCGVATFSR